MKTSKALAGAAFALIGIGLIVWGFLLANPPSIIFGLGGGFLGGGLAMLGRHLYWTSPKRRDQLAAHLEELEIERSDELKQSLRRESGHITYVITFFAISGTLILLQILQSLAMIEVQPVILTLSLVWLFMFIGGFVVFYTLKRRYA